MKGESGEVVLGGYRIDYPLGHGGVGRIHVGRQVSLHREVAIKSVRPDMAGAVAIRERFRREAVLAASINHPNVVTYYDFGVDDDGDLILVMERLKGWTLLEEMRKHPRVPAAITARRIREAAAGLGAAHEAGIIHRDVKPSNLFLVGPGTPAERVKLIDFGILRVAVDAQPALGDLEDLTHSDAFIGTPDYAAPEMILGANVDGRADQYALALVALLMLTGRKGFVSREPCALLARVSRRPDAIEDPPEGGGGLAGPVRDVLYRALTPDPEGRYRTVGAFADALVMAVASDAGDASWACGPTGLLEWVTPLDGMPVRATPRPSSRRFPRWGFAVMGVMATVAVGALAWTHGSRADGQVGRPVVEEPALVQVAADLPSTVAVAQQPDAFPEPVATESATGPEGVAVAVAAELSGAPGETVSPVKTSGDHRIDESPVENELGRSPKKVRTAQPGRQSTRLLPAAVLVAGPRPDEAGTAAVVSSVPATVGAGELAKLTFNAEPWAEVRLDGRLLGTTPLVGVAAVAGRHRIEFRHPKLGVRKLEPNVRSGESRTFRIRFEEAGSGLSSGSEASGVH